MNRFIRRLVGLLRGEAGFTYLESVMATAITALVLGTIVVTLYQFNVLTRRQGDSLTVNQQMENLATMLNHDVVSAREGAVASGGTQLTLQVVRHEFNQTAEPVTTTIVYALSGADVARTADGVTQRVARYVSSADFGPDGPLPATVRMTLTSSLREESVPAVMTFERRPAN